MPAWFFLFVLAIVAIVFIGLPWIIFHYVTRWKTAATLTSADESLLEEMHDIARRLDERVCTVERIMASDTPNWRSTLSEAATPAIDTHDTLRRIK
jgi:phage shock protein B